MTTTFRAVTDKPGLKPTSFIRRSKSHNADRPFTHAVIYQMATGDERSGLWVLFAFCGSYEKAVQAARQVGRPTAEIEIVPVEIVV